jgi:hypothetical protein
VKTLGVPRLAAFEIAGNSDNEMNPKPAKQKSTSDTLRHVRGFQQFLLSRQLTAVAVVAVTSICFFASLKKQINKSETIACKRTRKRMS